MLARAALGYGGRNVWEPDHERTQPLSRLLEEALAELPEASLLRARVARSTRLRRWLALGRPG